MREEETFTILSKYFESLNENVRFFFLGMQLRKTICIFEYMQHQIKYKYPQIIVQLLKHFPHLPTRRRSSGYILLFSIIPSLILPFCNPNTSMAPSIQPEWPLFWGWTGHRRRVSAIWLRVLLWSFSSIISDLDFVWDCELQDDGEGARLCTGWWMVMLTLLLERSSLLKPFSETHYHSWLQSQAQVAQAILTLWVFLAG